MTTHDIKEKDELFYLIGSAVSVGWRLMNEVIDVVVGYNGQTLDWIVQTTPENILTSTLRFFDAVTADLDNV
jgi:hypothetical protein